MNGPSSSRFTLHYITFSFEVYTFFDVPCLCCFLFKKNFVCHSRVGLRGSLEIQKEEDLLNTEHFRNGVKNVNAVYLYALYMRHSPSSLIFFFKGKQNMFSRPLPANKTIKFHILLLLSQIDDLDVVPAGFEIVPQQVVEGA